MVMSRDPRSKFRKKIIFFLILHSILGKVTKFLMEKLFRSYQPKTSRGEGGWKTPVLLGLKNSKFFIQLMILIPDKTRLTLEMHKFVQN